MLKHIIFITVFLCAFVIFLAFALEIVSIVFGSGGISALPWGQLGRLQAIIFGAVIFVIISGFMPIYITLYVIYMRKISRISREIITVLIYISANIILWCLFGSWPKTTDGVLMVLGIIGILSSDLLAEKIASKIEKNNKGSRVN